MKIEPGAISGMKVTVMGLGLNSGGLASALFFARRGADVTVTDLRDAQTLQSSLDALRGLSVRFTLGGHEERDFLGADLVVKNPAVSPSSPFLQIARSRGAAIETDISMFLSLASNPILAVTGSKGKSTTASAIAYGLEKIDPGTKLGGNITVSPLSFLDSLDPRAPVVLELSSWQLGDLRGRGLLAPVISAFTVILPDHLDKYNGMTDYIADKTQIFREQGENSKAIFNHDDPWQNGFSGQTRAQAFFYSAQPLPEDLNGAWLEGGAGHARLGRGGIESKEILSKARIPGHHNRLNLLCAGLALRLYGVKAEVIRKALAEFPGIEHRLEMCREWNGIRFYNDSAATIPHATVEALKSVEQPIVLIAGGTDKNIDFSLLADAARELEAIVLLDGTATRKIQTALDARETRYEGPFGDLQSAVTAAVSRARRGGSVLFSPGCASFGMFLNEFDRGKKFKQIVGALG